MKEPEFKALQSQAYQYIRERILNGTLNYNQIYSESKMAVDIGISRTPVRDAIHRLYQEGLIDIIPSKGFVLHKMTERDVIETYETRSAVEGYCSRKLAQENQTDSVRLLLSEIQASIDLQQQIFDHGGDVEQFAEEDQHFHYLMISHSDNELFLQIFRQYMHRIKKLACFSLSKEGRMEQTLFEHREIVQAIRSGDWQTAYDATLAHMRAPLDFNLESVYK